MEASHEGREKTFGHNVFSEGLQIQNQFVVAPF